MSLQCVSVRDLGGRKGRPGTPCWGLVDLCSRHPFGPPLLRGGWGWWGCLFGRYFGDSSCAGGGSGAASGPRLGSGGGGPVPGGLVRGTCFCGRGGCSGWHPFPPLRARRVPGMVALVTVGAFGDHQDASSVFLRALLGRVLPCAYAAGLPPVAYALMVTKSVTLVTPKRLRNPRADLEGAEDS